ncbi:MAG TPA: NlpC/P60 family protein, partial [Verrucomicrobiales bacterium]|nr:NlpC/P60 family protein [Verrucomicrobiales bacterium]
EIAGTGWPAMRDGDSLWPPQANDLAHPSRNIRSLTNARNLRSGDDKANPELGDVISFPSTDGSGHTGLYLGKNLIVSAKETGIEVHPLEYEHSQHGDTTRIRKFTGSGK